MKYLIKKIKPYIKNQYKIISFPKCGRTWLRLMLGTCVDIEYKLDLTPDEKLLLHRVKKAKLRHVRFDHDQNVHHQSYKNIDFNYNLYKNQNVILLCRDPRDVTISHYFQLTKRESKHIDFNDFLYSDVGSVMSIIKFYNEWAYGIQYLKNCLILRYEDMLQAPHISLKNFINFINLRDISNDTIYKSVKLCSFENMKKMEKNKDFNNNRMRPSDIGDQDSFKVRKGIVGGYKEYCTQEQIDYLNSQLKNLDPIFDYKI